MAKPSDEPAATSSAHEHSIVSLRRFLSNSHPATAFTQCDAAGFFGLRVSSPTYRNDDGHLESLTPPPAMLSAPSALPPRRQRLQPTIDARHTLLRPTQHTLLPSRDRRR